MSADTDNRDQPDVQHRATVSDSHIPGRPDAIESDRRVKMQAALHGAATRAAAIGRYLWAEFRATTMATASQTWRLVRYGIASARLNMSRRTLRRAHLALGEKLYQVGSGDPVMRDAIRGLDEQIKAASEAKRSTSKLVAQRREQLIQLAECLASTGGASPTEPEHDRVLTCWQNLNGDLHRLESTRIHLWPTSSAETKRVVVGAGVCLLVLVAVFMLPSSHNGGTQRSADGNVKGAGVSSATATSNPQTPAPAVAPFDVAQAKQHQQAWASHLGVPVETINSIGMKLVLIPPGEFLMGSPDSDTDAKEAERPQHRVRITKPYYLGIYEVTQGEYLRVMGANPSGWSRTSDSRDLVWSRDVVGSRDTSRFAVENVSWEDAVEFCLKLSALPGERSSQRLYRLPTEAEWENACRAGTTTPYHTGLQLGVGNANYKTNPSSGESDKVPNSFKLPMVGSYGANAFGLCDMHGNVEELCSDWYDSGYYAASTVDDPTGPTWGNTHVIRGGCLISGAGECRSAYRSRIGPRHRMVCLLGFRVAFTSVEASASKQKTEKTGDQLPQSKSPGSTSVPVPPERPYDDTDREDAKMEFLRKNAPMVIMGESLGELYKRHPDAKRGVLKRNPDGSQELQWGGGLGSFQVLLNEDKVMVYHLRVFRISRETAERYALEPREVFGEPLSTDLPKNDPKVVSCNRWRYNGYSLKTAVVMDRPIKGSAEYAYYSDLEVGNLDAVEAILGK